MQLIAVPPEPLRHTLPLVFAVALLGSALATALVIRAAAAWGWYDDPDRERRVHTRPVPRLGGIAVFAGMTLGLGAAALRGAGNFDFSVRGPSFYAGILFGGAVLFLAGLRDDLRGLRPLHKLAVQLVAALIAYAYGFRVELLSLGASAEWALGALALPLTVLWIVGVTNAFNLIDGLDGLATGVALVALGTTLAVSLTLNNVSVNYVCVALIGALFGFLRFNFSPARIFLGDSGSLFIGFMLAVLSVGGSMKSATVLLVLVPVLSLAVPLADAALAVFRRLLRGTPLARGDARHIHHRLLAQGLSHRRAAMVLYLLAAVPALVAMATTFAPPRALQPIVIAGGVVLLFLTLFGVRWLDYHEFAEAGSVVMSGLRNARHIIRKQIHARDMLQVLSVATTLEEVNAVLLDAAADFDLLQMELAPAYLPEQVYLIGRPGTRYWRLEYPIGFAPADDGAEHWYVLRVRCALGDEPRLNSVERVIRMLAPALRAWVLAHTGGRQTPGSELDNRDPTVPGVPARTVAPGVKVG